LNREFQTHGSNLKDFSMLCGILFGTARPLQFATRHGGDRAIVVCLQQQRGFAASGQGQRLLSLNDISNVDGAIKKRKRWGRGIGSGKGKNSGFGHQKSRSTPRAFEGGQTPLYKRLPKIGFHNINHREMQVLNLDKVQEFIDTGRLQPKQSALLTMRDLLESGIVSQVKEGIKLLAKGKEDLRVPIHLEVSQASVEAIKAVEKAGGTVTCVHFNELALRALLKPFKFEILPHRARPPPRLMNYYLDRTKAGYLSPEIQVRNLKLFGHVTSEDSLRDEFERFMNKRRALLKEMREEIDNETRKLAEEAASSSSSSSL